MNIPTREELKKALGRKPVEGCSKGPWRANLYLGGAYAIDRVAPNGDVLTRIAVADGAMETRANGELLAMALDLQDENQVLQAAVRQMRNQLVDLRDAADTDEDSDAEVLMLVLKHFVETIDKTLARMSTEGKRDDATTR